MAIDSLPDRWLEVSMRDGSTFKAEIGCLEQVESAYRSFNEQAPLPHITVSQDRVIDIPLICGATLTIMVSGIGYLMATGQVIAENVWTHNRLIRQAQRATDPDS